MLPEIPQADLVAQLWQLVDAIPLGCVVSYGDLAAALGDKTAARWVATELLHHEIDAARCPCHRVIRKSGDVGQFAHGTSHEKRKRLVEEGVTFSDVGNVVGPWLACPAVAEPPFRLLANWQESIVSQSLPELAEPPNEIAALDVSYFPDGSAVAACVLIDRHVPAGEAAKVLWHRCVVTRPGFPYISGYLVFRELPALLAAWKLAVDEGVWPLLAVIDGSGQLHPRKAGIATCFAILTQTATIGVTKKLLAGRYDDTALKPGQTVPILDGDQTIGTAMRSPTGGKPVFVSPGAGISQAAADAVIAHTLTVHRVPEPIYWADRLSRDFGAGTPTH